MSIRFNSYWTEQGRLELVHINLAVAVDEGLIAPAVLDADTLSATQTTRALRDLVGRAHEGGLRSQEITGGSFTLRNLGMFDVASFYGIITTPRRDPHLPEDI